MNLRWKNSLKLILVLSSLIHIRLKDHAFVLRHRNLQFHFSEYGRHHTLLIQSTLPQICHPGALQKFFQLILIAICFSKLSVAVILSEHLSASKIIPGPQDFVL